MERQLDADNAVRDVNRFARAFEEHTVRTIKGADQTLLALKYQYEKEGKAIDLLRYASEQSVVSQPVFQLTIVDETGESVASSIVPFVPVNIRDREHFLVHADADSRQLFISKPVLGRVSGKWSIQMTRRVNKPEGSFGGVAVVSVDPYYFSEFYKQVDLGKNSSIALIGRDGVVRVRQDGQTVNVGQDFSNSVVIKKLLASDSGHYITRSMVDGIKRIYGYRALSDYPLVVAVGVDEVEVYKGLNERIVGYYWLAGAITLGIILFVGLLLAIIARQKLTAQELKQARDGLEAQVGQRTQELSVANEELTVMNKELQRTNQKLEVEIDKCNRIEASLKASEAELLIKNAQLTKVLQDIGLAQAKLIQQEKLAGIGQLAAGVAHEINNPLGFITNNITALEQYCDAFRIVISQYRKFRAEVAAVGDLQFIEIIDQIVHLEEEQDLDYILADMPDLFRDTSGGLSRMNKLVKGMRIFSRVDQQHAFDLYDLNKGLENTLVIANNEIKHAATVETSLENIPAVEAIRSEIDQVLLNLVINAVQAIQETHREERGLIKISTWHDEQFVYCSIEDDGTGIEPQNLDNIFTPFFTTKPVGQGTGMGLSISHEIIVTRHRGELKVESVLGEGTKFIVKLPIKHDLLATIINSSV